MSSQQLPTEQPLLSCLSPSRWGLRKDAQTSTRMLIVAGAVFLPVVGVGVAISTLRDSPASVDQALSEAHGGALAELKDYTRSISAEGHGAGRPANKVLPDVKTMIDRLVSRLEAAPDDAKGWRMLGWSYFHTERYDEAATAYAKAVQLDPGSAELKLEYEQAKAKATKGGRPGVAAALAQTEVAQHGSEGPSAEQIKTFQAMQPHDREAAIRGMVDGLANRLAHSPRDVDGWTRLMRSRVVLGENDSAATAFRTALEVFKDDSAATTKIKSSADELGLKAE